MVENGHNTSPLAVLSFPDKSVGLYERLEPFTEGNKVWQVTLRNYDPEESAMLTEYSTPEEAWAAFSSEVIDAIVARSP